MTIKSRWGLVWREYDPTENRIIDMRVMWRGGEPLLFRTRAEARAHATEHYGYLRDRDDLRQPPFNWRMPGIRRVRLSVELDA